MRGVLEDGDRCVNRPARTSERLEERFDEMLVLRPKVCWRNGTTLDITAVRRR